MPKLFKGTHEILSLAGGTQNVKALYAGNRLVFGEKEPNIIHVGEHDYHFVKIGNLYWFDENFHENVPGYSKWNSEPNYEYYGRYYTWNGWSSRDLFPELYAAGFRVPSREDYKNLVESVSSINDLFVGGSSGFNAITSGGYNINGTLVRFGTRWVGWSSTVLTSYDQGCLAIEPTSGFYNLDDNWNNIVSKCPMRFCKDA